MKFLVHGLVFGALSLGMLVAACGEEGSKFDDGANDGKGDGGSNVPPFGFDRDGSTGEKACTNLCLKQIDCNNSPRTSISGTVTDPAGKLPLYNVLVYVPNAPVGPLEDGAVCDRCGKVSGEPLVSRLTGIDGKFTLPDVPVGVDFPLVIQIGKWRRQITIPAVTACVDTPIETSKLRMPRNKTEGDIPRIAITTGGLDVMECWLRKVGIDDTEFTRGDGDGRVHLYTGAGQGETAQATSKFDGAHNGGADFTLAKDFWDSTDELKRYDLVVLGCEGQTDPANKPPAALRAMRDYANLGGRIFATHWQRYWFNTAERSEQLSGGVDTNPAGPEPSPFGPDTASWKDRSDPLDPAYGDINETFEKGKALKQWLGQPGVDALSGGQLNIRDPRHNVDAVGPGAKSWISFNNVGGEADIVGKTTHAYVTFNTPVGSTEENQCGRVVFTSIHVTTNDTHAPWPSGCISGEMTEQEKTLEFMLFDLSSCVQSDDRPPAPPVN